ncbi:MAG: carbon storage regulator CsrA [bacterium]
MLVLTRKSGEGIWIGDNIQIRVLEIREGQVRLGITAPEGKGIYREELYERVRGLNLLAARSKREDVGSL